MHKKNHTFESSFRGINKVFEHAVHDLTGIEVVVFFR